jgi:hypothetical protein
MKRIIALLVALLIVSPMFSQTDDLVATGWRQNLVLSYCDEYDVMSGDNGNWVVRWGSSREVIKAALARDGFAVIETDSTISWTQNSIYRCELQFNALQRLKTVMYIITVPINHGISISKSLKEKFTAIYGSTGKFKMIGSSSAYTWLDQRCGRKPIYALQANSVTEGGPYIITVIASRIGE